jgi:hypothetical protein
MGEDDLSESKQIEFPFTPREPESDTQLWRIFWSVKRLYTSPVLLTTFIW